MQKLIEAIRNDPHVGRTTQSAIQMCDTDDEIAEMLVDAKISTVENALKWAYFSQTMWLEQNLNARPGEDDDPQLIEYNEWKSKKLPTDFLDFQ